MFQTTVFKPYNQTTTLLSHKKKKKSEMENENCITVTHFINPHLFWYKSIEAPGEEFHVISAFEQSLSNLYKNKPSCDNSLRPQKGDKVAVNFIAWNKFIRAEILEKNEFQQEEYIVWALDYGFPLLTKKQYIRNLPVSLRADIGYIRVGGISNVYPAEQEYDVLEGNLVMVKKDIWLQRTCNILEKLLADSNSVSFYETHKTENGHTWGDLLIVNHKGVQINAREYLLKTTTAVEEDEIVFKNNCSKFKSIKIAPWLSNDRNTKFRYNTIKHNCVEFSKHLNAALVDENAKRKFEDWQARNERKKVEIVPAVLETSSETSEYYIDDVTFDDSVSVANEPQINYMGKAGIITKIKQQKYSSEKDLPPSALPKFFEIDEMMSKLSPTEFSGTRTPAQNDFDGSDVNNSKTPLIDLKSESSMSKASSVKMRQQNLLEMRKKHARAEKEAKLNTSIQSQKLNNSNETKDSMSSLSKTLNSNPYHFLEQSSTMSTSRNTTIDNVQDNKSELSVKNIRIKHLIAMRKKVSSSIVSSSSDCSQKMDNKESNTSVSTNVPKVEKVANEMDKNKFDQLPQMYSVKTPSKNGIQESIKLAKSGYDCITMVPAGFDITRLQTYKDEKNHWHRKKSTRNDYVPHDNSSSTNELLSSTAFDQSFSSSDNSLTNPFKGFSQNPYKKQDKISAPDNKSFSIGKSERDSQKGRTCSEQLSSNKGFGVKNTDGNNLSSELSASSDSSGTKQYKRRKLKSPTGQFSKIDKILMEHCIEKENGNNNILDLQLLNTSSSSQKSLLASTCSNASYRKTDTPPHSIEDNVSLNSTSRADKIPNEKAYKDVLNYEALMEVKHTESLPIVEGERKFQTKYIDHLVLAHSSIQLTPIENISEAPFLPEIHEEMRQMRVNKVFRIQVYSWSHVSRNNSLFVVNPSRSGKTWSFLPPLCSLICCRKDTYKVSYGPVAIILVASLKHVESLNRYCKRLMSGFKNEAPTCVPSYGMRNLIETKIHLLNGCEILIATPSNILRLLHENENENLFDEDRLQHIVIDDMDIMMSRSEEDFKTACSTLFKMAKKSNSKKLLPQLIVTSRDWDSVMVKLIRMSNQPLLLIGDFLEAAVYGHATLSVKLKPNNDKNETILKFLKESAQDTDNRILIICNEDEDVQNICTFLKDCGYYCISYDSCSTETERVTIEEWKKKLTSQILVCTDARFCELRIQNVNNLIHYSMPTSWTQFTRRFSALARTYNNFVSQFENSKLPTSCIVDKNSNAYSMIILDENNNLQLPRLVDFMRKHNQKVKDEIQAVAKRVLIIREEQRILNILCPQLLEFGECDEQHCDYRHEVTRFDAIKKDDNMPRNGEIRLHVLKVFSPTYYAVRLMRHKPQNSVKWCEIRRSSEAATFSIQLNRYYSDEKNLSLHWPPHINDICIYQYAESYRRARIQEAPTFQNNEVNIVQGHLKVTLKLIDEGSVISSVKCNEIFLCAEQFKTFPAQAVDIRLIKVVPFDNERHWDSKTTKQVQNWIIEDIKPNYVVQASIDFAFANTIWVKNMVVMEKLSGIDAYRQVVNLKRSLIEKNFGVLYNGDRRQVRDIVEQFDLLNSSQLDAETGDSDLDYQSCKNESTDLILFSSSNNETTSSMESAENNIETTKNNKPTELKRTTIEAKSDGNACKASKDDEENWDCLDGDKQIEEIYDPYQIGKLDRVVNANKESWTKLHLKDVIKVEIGDEGENGNWENIFLQTIDKKSTLAFEELNKLIVEHVEKLKSNKESQQNIYDFEPLHNCLVKYNNLYLRAKVYGVYGDKVQERLYRFFLCDYACFTNVKTEDLYNDFLYETTEEIVTFTPYQAIHCTLAGIKWDHFAKRYQVTKDYLYACAVLENDTNKMTDAYLKNLPIHSYKILLYECEKEDDFNNASLFNKTLVDNGITVYDEETKAFLEYEIGFPQEEPNQNQSSHDEEEKADVPKSYDTEKVLTYEQIMDLMKSGAFDIDMSGILPDENKSDVATNALSKDQRKSTESVNIKEILDEKRVSSENNKIAKSDIESDKVSNGATNSNSNLKSSFSSDVSNCPEPEPSSELPLPPLKALHKRPLTTWYQNECMLFLSIYAPDVSDYHLEVTSEKLFFKANIHSEESVLILNFLGSIDLNSVSHEIKGINVVVRLKKNYFIIWPRLLQESTKYSWLKYNFNAFDSIEMEYIAPQQILHNMLESELSNQHQEINSSNSDEDSERELYQTYNPIQNDDDDCDPFSGL